MIFEMTKKTADNLPDYWESDDDIESITAAIEAGNAVVLHLNDEYGGTYISAVAYAPEFEDEYGNTGTVILPYFEECIGPAGGVYPLIGGITVNDGKLIIYAYAEAEIS